MMVFWEWIEGVLTFLDSQGQKAKAMGTHGESKLQLVTATNLLKGLHKNQMIYALKLNLTSKNQDTQDPEWLSEYADVFLEELIELSPVREVDHAIELGPGAQHVAKRSYKMSVPESIELKEQLTQLLDQDFIGQVYHHGVHQYSLTGKRMGL